MKPKTLPEACEIYIQHLGTTGKGKDTIRTYRGLLRRFYEELGAIPMSKLQDSDIEAYCASDEVVKTKQGGMAGSQTLGRHRRLVWRTMAWFKKKGWVTNSPTGKKKKPKALKVTVPVKVSRESVKENDLREDIVVADAVKFINDRVERTAESMLEIGRYLLQHFFDDDPKKVRAQSPHKGVSLRQLSRHPDINMSPSMLSRAVIYACYERETSSVSTLTHLSASHKVVLFRIEDIKVRNKYAKRVAKDNLSVRQLQAMLMEDGQTVSRGLGSLDQEQRQLVHFGLNQVVSPIEALLKASLDKFELKTTDEEISREMVTDTLNKMKSAKEKLDQFIAQLETRL